MRNLVLASSLIFLIGCGGSGGENTNINTSDNGKTYNLKNIYKNNYSFNTQMTSTASSDKFEYLMSSTIQQQTTFNGKTVTPLSTISSISNKTTGGVDSFNTTSYYNLDGHRIHSINHDTGVTCDLVNNPTLLSENTKVGDSGVGSYMDCSDGTSYKETWTLISIGNDVWLQKNVKLYGVSGELSVTEKDKYKIDTQGKISKASIELYLVSQDVTLKISEASVNSR